MSAPTQTLVTDVLLSRPMHDALHDMKAGRAIIRRPGDIGGELIPRELESGPPTVIGRVKITTMRALLKRELISRSRIVGIGTEFLITAKGKEAV